MNFGNSHGISVAVAGGVVIIVVVAALAGYYVATSTFTPNTVTSVSTVTGPPTTVTSVATSTSTATPGNAIVPLRVFAAASFSSGLQSIQSSYQLNNSVSLIYNFASSGSLETQIAQGSPADVFMSADASNNQKLMSASLLANGNTYQTLIYNYIQVYVAANNPKNITGLSDLLKPGVRIAIGAPASVPAGAYTLQVWSSVQSKWGNSSNPDFKSAVYANYTKNMMTQVVSQNTDVESAITQVLTGAADTAFGYVSDGIANAAQLHAVAIPSDVNVQAIYTVSVIKNTAYLAQANAFVNYLLSPQGQAFLKKWGFTPLQSVSTT